MAYIDLNSASDLELDSFLDEVVDNTLSVVDDAMENVLDETLAYTKGIEPVDTGVLKASTFDAIDRYKTSGTSLLSYSLIFPPHYSIDVDDYYLEKGLGADTPNPHLNSIGYLGPTFRYMLRATEDVFGRTFSFEVDDNLRF